MQTILAAIICLAAGAILLWKTVRVFLKPTHCGSACSHACPGCTVADAPKNDAGFVAMETLTRQKNPTTGVVGSVNFPS